MTGARQFRSKVGVGYGFMPEGFEIAMGYDLKVGDGCISSKDGLGFRGMGWGWMWV